MISVVSDGMSDPLDAPTIFRLAGFNSDKAQWISGLNNIFYMVST